MPNGKPSTYYDSNSITVSFDILPFLWDGKLLVGAYNVKEVKPKDLTVEIAFELNENMELIIQ